MVLQFGTGLVRRKLFQPYCDFQKNFALWDLLWAHDCLFTTEIMQDPILLLQVESTAIS